MNHPDAFCSFNYLALVMPVCENVGIVILNLQGKSCMLVAGDVYRPAAIDQLVILGQQVTT